MSKDKVTNIDVKKDSVSFITSIGKTLYEPYGRILALRYVENRLLEVIRDINIEINKQQAIVDSNKDEESNNGK